MKKEQLTEAFNLLTTAKSQICFADYQYVFGPLADHIWRQEGSDLLGLWTSGLTTLQKENFVSFLIHKKFK